jgi:hypothetical protein
MPIEPCRVSYEEAPIDIDRVPRRTTRTNKLRNRIAINISGVSFELSGFDLGVGGHLTSFTDSKVYLNILANMALSFLARADEDALIFFCSWTKSLF